MRSVKRKDVLQTVRGLEEQEGVTPELVAWELGLETGDISRVWSALLSEGLLADHRGAAGGEPGFRLTSLGVAALTAARRKPV